MRVAVIEPRTAPQGVFCFAMSTAVFEYGVYKSYRHFTSTFDPAWFNGITRRIRIR